ncbi:MAG TPA: glycosyltransferase family 4 protein, partial [Actinomycetota bacterium]|nr:glycosyltransferase family 4 protein [Actinomycetota bacterium]
RGIPVQTVPFLREPSPLADLRTVAALKDLFARRRYHVVHSHTPKAGLLAPLAARLARTPVILHTIHGLLFHDRTPAARKVLGVACELWTSRLSHRLLSQAREDLRTVTRYRLSPADRIEYIGNGIDVRRFSRESVPDARTERRKLFGVPEDAIVVGMVGRLVEEKGFREFVHAMGQVMAARQNVRMLLVAPRDAGQSDGIRPERLLRMVDPSRVLHLGFRSDLPELYSAMDVFVLPSYREGIPRTVLEASAMELPVVASDIRGCREAVVDGLTGLLVEPRDPRALATAISSLVDDAEERKRMGKAGRQHVVTEFDAELVLDRLSDFYRRVVPAA